MKCAAIMCPVKSIVSKIWKNANKHNTFTKFKEIICNLVGCFGESEIKRLKCHLIALLPCVAFYVFRYSTDEHLRMKLRLSFTVALQSLCIEFVSNATDECENRFIFTKENENAGILSSKNRYKQQFLTIWNFFWMFTIFIFVVKDRTHWTDE